MSDDSRKTKKQLLRELQELRRRLAERPVTDDGPKKGSKDPIFAGEVDRRTVLKTVWVAPVILSIPVAAGTVRAQLPPSFPPFLLPSPPPAPPSIPPVLPPAV